MSTRALLRRHSRDRARLPNGFVSFSWGDGSSRLPKRHFCSALLMYFLSGVDSPEPRRGDSCACPSFIHPLHHSISLPSSSRTAQPACFVRSRNGLLLLRSSPEKTTQFSLCANVRM